MPRAPEAHDPPGGSVVSPYEGARHNSAQVYGQRAVHPNRRWGRLKQAL